jgi:hypothetical protein
MNTANSALCAVVLIALAACSSSSRQATGQTGKEEQKIRVRAEDVGKTVEIIGRLGQPLGNWLTVQGKWIQEHDRMRRRGLYFEVSILNGKALDHKIEFLRAQVEPVFGDGKGGGFVPGAALVWKYDWNGNLPLPTPHDGETWEVVAVEQCAYRGISQATYDKYIDSEVPNNWQGRPAQPGGFYSLLDCIEVRIVK